MKREVLETLRRLHRELDSAVLPMLLTDEYGNTTYSEMDVDELVHYVRKAITVLDGLTLPQTTQTEME